MIAAGQSLRTKVFISYSRRDLAFVDKIQVALKSLGVDAAVDRTEIAKGEEWWKRIKQLITEADTVVFVLSPNSVVSDICQDEVDFAEKRKKRIVPIVVEDVSGHKVPIALARLNYVFFTPNAAAGTTGEFDASLDDLVRVLETDIGWVREHTRIGALAHRWQGHRVGRGHDLLLRGAELEAAEQWLASRPANAPELSDAHIAYLAQSRRAATRRQRWIAGISAAAAVVAISLAGLAYFQFVEASRQRATTAKISREAQSTESGLLSEAARVISDQAWGGDAPLAMLLAIEGVPDATSDDTRQSGRPVVAEAQLQLDRAFRNNRERAILAHDSPVTAVAWSLEGNRLMTGDDATARIFDATSGKELARVVHDGEVLGWSPDGRLVLTVTKEGAVRIIEALTGVEHSRLATTFKAKAAAWNPDGRLLAVVSADEAVRVIEVGSGKDLGLLSEGHSVRAVAWSPDGRLLATGSGDGAVRVFEASTRKEVIHIASDRAVTVVAWGPDGKRLAIGSEDTIVRVLEVSTGKELTRVVHDHGVTAATWNFDGRRLATGSGHLGSLGYAGEARIIDAASGRELARIAHGHAVQALAWSPDGRLLATGSGDGSARIVDAAQGRELSGFVRSAPVWSTAWSPDGRRVAVRSGGGDKSEVRAIEVSTRTELAGLAHDGEVFSVAWSPDGQRLATGDSKAARIFDPIAGNELARLRHDGEVFAVAWSADGRWLATGAGDGTLRIVEASTGKEISRFAHEGGVGTVAWSPDGSRLATGAGDHTARIVEASTGKQLLRIDQASLVWAVAWSPSGRWLATSDKLGVRIIEAETGSELARIAHDEAVIGLAWSPDGQQLATVSLGILWARVFEAVTGKEHFRLAHDDAVHQVAWSPDGRLLATASQDKTVRIFEAARGQEVSRLDHDSGVVTVSWNPAAAGDGASVITGSEDGTVRHWRVFPSTQALVDAAKARAARCLSQKQRAQYFLPPAPPTWCVERRLWPYHRDEWQAWLSKQKTWLASGREGEGPMLPRAE